MAGSLSKLAELATARGDPKEARRVLNDSLAARRAALSLAPGNAEYVKSVATGCAELIEELLRLKDHQAASKIALELVSLSPDSGQESLRASSFLSRCVTLAAADSALPEARRAELAKACADQAVALVKDAIEKGHRDLEVLRKDASFDSVRARPDFGSLLAGADAASKNPKP
jgi:hypothetical protein